MVANKKSNNSRYSKRVPKLSVTWGLKKNLDSSFYDKYKLRQSFGSAYFEGHRLEELIRELMVYAQLPYSTTIAQFLAFQCLDHDEWNDMLNRHQELASAYKKAKVQLEANALANKGIDAAMSLLYKISNDWKEAEERKAMLKNFEENPIESKQFPNIFNSPLPTEKKDV
jgi:hypothetical protein